MWFLQYILLFSCIAQTGRSCLHLDKVVKNLPLLQLLVDEFASQNISVEQYATVWWPFDGCENYDSALNLMTWVYPQNWYSPLLMACLAGERCKDAVELLLSAGANPDGHDRVISMEWEIIWDTEPCSIASCAGYFQTTYNRMCCWRRWNISSSC